MEKRTFQRAENLPPVEFDEQSLVWSPLLYHSDIKHYGSWEILTLLNAPIDFLVLDDLNGIGMARLRISSLKLTNNASWECRDQPEITLFATENFSKTFAVNIV